MKHVICVDLGGTKIAAAILRADDSAPLNPEIVFETEEPTATESAKVLKEQLFRVINSCLKHADSFVDAISLGVPGLVDYDMQKVVVCPNIPLQKIDLKSEIEKKFSIRTLLDNDANIATLGEKYFGEGRGVKNFICITIGTGIGGGIVVDGKIYRGETGGAGEFGHMILNDEGPQCSCGQRGCFEKYSSGTAIADHAKQMLKLPAYKDSILHKVNKQKGGLTSEDVVEAAKHKDQLGKDVIKLIADMIAIACVNLVNILDPKMIIFFGGVIKAGDLIFKPIKDGIERKILGTTSRKIIIKKASLLNKAAVLGAYALFLEECHCIDETGSYHDDGWYRL